MVATNQLFTPVSRKKCQKIISRLSEINTYTESRLQRVRLERAPSYNEQISYVEIHVIGTDVKKVFFITSTVYSELNFVNLTAHCKRDPVYLKFSVNLL